MSKKWHKCMLCDCEYYGEGKSYLDYCPSCRSEKSPKVVKKPAVKEVRK